MTMPYALPPMLKSLRNYIDGGSVSTDRRSDNISPLTGKAQGAGTFDKEPR